MSRLEETHDPGGRRYILDDEPLHAGAQLEVHLERGWLPVRFELDAQQFPVFYLRLGNGDQVPLRLPDDADLRLLVERPARSESDVRKLRQLVTQLAEMLTYPDDYDRNEQQDAARLARSVLMATAPRLPEEA